MSHFCASWKIKTTDNINKEVPFYVSGKCYREKEKKKRTRVLGQGLRLQFLMKTRRSHCRGTAGQKCQGGKGMSHAGIADKNIQM